MNQETPPSSKGETSKTSAEPQVSTKVDSGYFPWVTNYPKHVGSWSVVFMIATLVLSAVRALSKSGLLGLRKMDLEKTAIRCSAAASIPTAILLFYCALDKTALEAADGVAPYLTLGGIVLIVVAVKGLLPEETSSTAVTSATT